MVSNPGAGSPLSVLGFSPGQERLYRVLLRTSDLEIDALAQILAAAPNALRDEVASLVAAGLVVVKDDVVVALPPDQTLSRMITDETRRLQSINEQLEALRGLLPLLSADHLTSRAPQGDPVTIEVIEGGDVVGLVRSLSSSSSGDLMWLRPDQWRVPAGPEIDEWVMSLIRSGRTSRAIYPARALDEAPQVLRARAEAGEHVRILASVPSRLAIMGTSAALVPESWGVNTERRLVVRQGAMIAAMTLLFNSLWERAMAVPGLDGQRVDGDAASDRGLLLDQLAGGAKDEQIARALGMSLRTVRRRVAAILEELGVDSRFHAGVEAVRRGWV